MNIGEKLKQLRLQKNLTQEEVAEQLAISLSSYQKYERKKNSVMPSIDALIQLADFYGVTTDYLLGRESPDRQPEPLELLSRQNNMDDAEELLFEKYLELPQTARDALIKMMYSFADELRKSTEQGITVYRAARSSDGKYEPPGEVRMTQEEIDEIANAEDADDL